MTQDPNLRHRLKVLASYLEVLESPGFVFGTWAGGEKIGPKTFTMPCVAFSEPATRFIHACYDNGWVLMDFAWPEWAQTGEAQAFVKSPELIEQASPDELAKLLTVCIRQDRFCEGALLSAFETGFLTAILKRADRLIAELD